MTRNRAVGRLLALAGLGACAFVGSLCPGPFSVYRVEVTRPGENTRAANAERPSASQTSCSRPPPVTVRRIVGCPSRFHSFSVVGEVVNNTRHNIRCIKVTGLFREAIDVVSTTAFAYTDLTALEPGEAAPFRVILTEVARQVDRYELLVEYEPAEEAPLRLEILNHAGYAPSVGWYRLGGAVRNPHPFSVAGAKIVATCYDAQDDVAGVEYAFCEASTLGPGRISPFDFVILEMASSAHHYRLQTEAIKKG